jgi:hypothetical protein
MSRATAEAYKAARDKMLADYEAKGFAQGPATTPAPALERREPARQVFRCPVHCCDPRTGLPLEVPEQGAFCRRHWEKLSGPLQHQLTGARDRGNVVEIATITMEAVKEARGHDERWHPRLVVDRGRIDGFEAWDTAVKRYWTLREQGFGPALISGVNGKQLTDDEIRLYCPHEVCAGSRVLSASDTPGRGDGVSPLHWALALAWRGHSHAWPADEVVVVNGFTGEELGYRQAADIVERHKR